MIEIDCAVSFGPDLESLDLPPEVLQGRFTPDIDEFREPLKRLLWEASRRARMAGLDAYGRPFAPMAEATPEWRTKRNPPDPEFGPVMIPNEDGSAPIRGLEVGVEKSGGGLMYTFSFPNDSWLAYHLTPSRNHITGRTRPARDVYGIPEQYMREIDEWILAQVMRQLLAYREANKPRGVLGRIKSGIRDLGNFFRGRRQ